VALSCAVVAIQLILNLDAGVRFLRYRQVVGATRKADLRVSLRMRRGLFRRFAFDDEVNRQLGQAQRSAGPAVPATGSKASVVRVSEPWRYPE
jgi:hypothetical protein